MIFKLTSAVRNCLVSGITLFSLAACSPQNGQPAPKKETYCNPLDIDYTYMVYNSDKNLSYRSGADPAVVEFREEYYMFVTRSFGYWHSTDLLNWEFVEPAGLWYPQGSNAPAAHNYKDSLLYVTGDPSGAMSILYSDNPAGGKWKAVPSILYDLQDPDLFIDDDGQAYMFWGSSNFYPIKGKKLDARNRFLPESGTVEIYKMDGDVHGWERFGEDHCEQQIKGYMEGAWLTKNNGRYYLQYGAPGTEFNVYGDGVLVSDSPLGPYTYQKHNPVSYKSGGFMNGAGHGSTVKMTDGSWWHFASMSMSAIVNWERRIAMFPTFFDEDGVMYCDNEYGDYPHYAPSLPGHKGEFTGWMLVSYKKGATASSCQEGAADKAAGFEERLRPETSSDFKPCNVTDENCKTYWLAEHNDSSEWICIDLEEPADICAIQLDFFDHKAGLYGRQDGLCHRYSIECSDDGENWKSIIDRRKSNADTPNAYIQLDRPVRYRYVRYSNISVPGENLAICGFRIFGKADGNAPEVPANACASRCEDRRSAFLSWELPQNAQGVNVKWGTAPDKLYNSRMVYEKNSIKLNCLSADTDYWFSIEAFGSTGVSEEAALGKI